MAQMVLASPELSDAATLVAGSEAGSMEVENLQLMQPTDIWRATDLNNAYITIDLGSAAAIDVIALLYTNASSTATWRVRAAATAADVTASPGYDSGSLSHWPTSGLTRWDRTHAVLVLAVAQSYQYWRIDVTDLSNADGFYQAGRLYLASAFRPTHGPNYGWGIEVVDPSQRTYSEGSALYVKSRQKYRKLGFTLSGMTEAEAYDNAFALSCVRGESTDILAIVDPANTSRIMDQTICGLLTSMPPIQQSNPGAYAQQFTVTELELP